MFNRLQNFFTRLSNQSITAGALIVAFFGILSRILGLVRDRILASHYGAGDVLDIYYAAFRLPDLIFELLVVGALGAAFIPVFSKLIAHKRIKQAQKTVSGVFIIIVGVMMLCSFVGILFAPVLMKLIVPGFNQEKLSQTVTLAKIMFLSPIFLSASAVLGGVLVSFRRFVLYSSAPLFYNVGIIVGATLLAPRFGLKGLAFGVVLGAFLHFMIHVVAIKSLGIKFIFNSSLYKNKHVRQVITLMIPRMFSSASNQISLLLITMFASLLASGSLTVFLFANNIQSVVLVLVGVPFAVAAFPVLANKYAMGKLGDFADILSQTLRRILYYSIPFSMLVFVLREQIVRVVYGAGHFGVEDTILTYQILGILCLSLFAQSAIPLLARGFYAMQNTKTPLYIALGSQVINIIVIALLIERFEIYAIAIAFSISAIFNAVSLFFFLHAKINSHKYQNTLRILMQIIISTFVSFIITLMVRNALSDLLPLQYVWSVLTQLVVSGCIGVTVYLFVTAIFGMKEFETIKKKIIIRIFARPQVANEEQNIVR